MTAGKETPTAGGRTRRTVLAIRHVAFEDLGWFEPVLRRAGYSIEYLDVGTDDLAGTDPLAPDVVVSLGGPVGAYQEDRYPWLAPEVDLLRRRLSAGRPTLGICLGAQLMARARGADVRPAPRHEIAVAPVTLTPQGQASPLAAFAGGPVLHWHGDNLDLPAGAVRLAATADCPVQAFALGTTALGVQFHPEAGGPHFERWLVGHAVELAAAGIDVAALRADHERAAPELRAAAERFLTGWLHEVQSPG